MYLKSICPNWKYINRLQNKSYIHFNLPLIGITSKPNYDFLISYNNLPIDKYHNNNDPPTRLRRYANYTIDVSNTHNYDIYINDNNIFEQNVTDDRGKPRTFELIESQFIKDHWILNLLTQMAALSVVNYNNQMMGKVINQKNNRIKNVNISLHQVRQITYPNISAHNSPEGIHQDGADYIVSAFVLNRINISGGDSIIYNKDKEEIYRTILYNGEGIYQEDKQQWHYIEPIQSMNHTLGFRDILGIDIAIENG